MKGFVPTPDALVDAMVARLFADRVPTAADVLLDPGCGEGVFIEGILRWCARTGAARPRIVGVELHPGRAAVARARFAAVAEVQIVCGDVLEADLPAADFVIGNPPYVAITGLSDDEKARYRARFATASGRFDLSALFFERALDTLRPGGRLVFVTTEKFLSVESARPLRAMLARLAVREVRLEPETTFPGRTTYPAVTVVDAAPPDGPARGIDRDGVVRAFSFIPDGAPVHALLRDAPAPETSGVTLGDVVRRISCGVATGADSVFVRPVDTLPTALRPFAVPTVSGRQLEPGAPVQPPDVMLMPYDSAGSLLAPAALGALGPVLDAHRARLERRTCARRKPWYAFHETPPLDDLLRPKLLCKDVADRAHFWADRAGEIVPRHSVYYIVPHRADDLDVLVDLLNGDAVADWLAVHAQPAANGFRRLQSAVLRQIPLPAWAADLAERVPTQAALDLAA